MTVDNVAGIVTVANFVVSAPLSQTFSVVESDAVYGSGSGWFIQTIAKGALLGSLPDFNLILPTNTLVGYTGGPLDSLSSVVLPGGGGASLQTGSVTSSIPLIAPTSIANAVSGQPYSVMFTAKGGSGTGYTWTLASGSLPAGFKLSSGGLLSSTGNPVDAPASYTFTVRVADSASNTATQPLTLAIQATGSVIVTVAGTGTPGPSTCGPGSGSCGPAANFNLQLPAALGFDSSGNLYIGQDNNLSPFPAALLKMASDGAITTAAVAAEGFNSVAGLQVLGPGAVPPSAQVPTAPPFQLLGSGSVYVCDWIGERVFLVLPGTTSSAPVVNIVAGSGALPNFLTSSTFVGDGGPAIAASFYYPWGVAVDRTGNLYISDSRNNRIRRVDMSTPLNTIDTVAGGGPAGGNGGFSGDNGPASLAQLNNPTGIAITPAGDLYIADSNNGRIRRVSPAGPNGIITTVAANLSGPNAVAVDPNGNVYVAEPFRILKVSASGVVTTIAGTSSSSGYWGDGGPPGNALFNMVRAIAVDNAGNLYIADSGNNRVRMIVNALLGIQNAASYATGAVSPGEIVVIYGTGIGPAALATSQVDGSTGLLETTVAGTTVLFNGIPAPILYTSAGQVSVIVPYEIAGAATTQILVNYQGNNVAAGTVTVAPSAPGIFTVNSGTGQAAVLNQDGSVNSANNPAVAGSVIALYLTGEGQTSPPGVDGKIAAPPLPAPVLPVTVTIGGQTATYVYAGAAPAEVAGVMQIDATVPAGVAGNAVPLSVQIGTASTQSGVTIAVRQ